MRITVLLLFVLFFTFANSLHRYKLLLYKSPDCLYCRFASKQISQIIKENFWNEIVETEIVENAEKNIVFEMRNEKNQKIAEISGVHSRAFFRDWIDGFVSRNPIQIAKENTPNSKYSTIAVSNGGEVQSFFRLKAESEKQKMKNKFDILKESLKTVDIHSDIGAEAEGEIGANNVPLLTPIVGEEKTNLQE